MFWRKRFLCGEFPTSEAEEEEFIAAINFVIAKRRAAPDPDLHWDALASDLYLICTSKLMRILFANGYSEME